LSKGEPELVKTATSLKTVRRVLQEKGGDRGTFWNGFQSGFRWSLMNIQMFFKLERNINLLIGSKIM